MKKEKDVPSGGVALQVFALPLEQAGPDLLGRVVILSGVVDLLRGALGDVRIDQPVVLNDEVGPLVILGHGDGPDTQLVDGRVGRVGLPLENTGVGIVGLLDLADDDGLELSTRAFQITVCLR